MIQQKRVYKKDRAHSTIKLSTKSDMTVKVKDHSKGDDIYMKRKFTKSLIRHNISRKDSAHALSKSISHKSFVKCNIIKT